MLPSITLSMFRSVRGADLSDVLGGAAGGGAGAATAGAGLEGVDVDVGCTGTGTAVTVAGMVWW